MPIIEIKRPNIPMADGELVDRAAKRANWAGKVLEGAAEDLFDAGGPGGTAFVGLTEQMMEHSALIARLAEDIESRRPSLDDERPTLPRQKGLSAATRSAGARRASPVRT